MNSLFVMNINIGCSLPDARMWGRKGGGEGWNSSEPSGSNLDRGSQERGNGFRLLLFALTLGFVRNESFPPHGSHALSAYLSADRQLIDATPHTVSARGVHLIPPHKHKTSVLLTFIKPTWPSQWESSASLCTQDAEDALLVWRARNLWCFQESFLSHSVDNTHTGLGTNADASARCAQEMKKSWWNERRKQHYQEISVWKCGLCTFIFPIYYNYCFRTEAFQGLINEFYWNQMKNNIDVKGKCLLFLIFQLLRNKKIISSNVVFFTCNHSILINLWIFKWRGTQWLCSSPLQQNTT